VLTPASEAVAAREAYMQGTRWGLVAGACWGFFAGAIVMAGAFLLGLAAI
jgi:CO dehydrogenase/acetyl-CoA synthase delta subunit